MREYNKIVLFDDRNPVINSLETLEQFKKAVCESIGKLGKSQKIEMSPNIQCIMYTQFWENNEEKWKQIVIDGDGNRIIGQNWIDKVKNKEFIFEEGTLVFCDYHWGAAPKDCQNLNQAIYDLAKDKDNLIFFCYSTILYEKAQKWVNSLYSQEHSCKLVKYAYTFAYDFYDFVESTKEALLHDWE